MTVQTDSPVEITDAIRYLRLISPPPEGDEVPWFTAIHRDGLLVLWEAVRRLEEIAHKNKTSSDVGGPVITGDEVMATRVPPPPPPPPGWHRGDLMPPVHK